MRCNIWHRRQTGFTLLEIMLVVVLISITISLVNLTIEPSSKSLLHEEAKRFVALLNQAQDESVLTGRPIAIEVDSADRTYQFLNIKDKSWQPITRDDVFRKRQWSRKIEGLLTLNTQVQSNGSEEESEPKVLRIIIEPTGQITPFVFELSAEKYTEVVELADSGRVRVQRDKD